MGLQSERITSELASCLLLLKINRIGNWRQFYGDCKRWNLIASFTPGTDQNGETLSLCPNCHINNLWTRMEEFKNIFSCLRASNHILHLISNRWIHSQPVRAGRKLFRTKFVEFSLISIFMFASPSRKRSSGCRFRKRLIGRKILLSFVLEEQENFAEVRKRRI